METINGKLVYAFGIGKIIVTNDAEAPYVTDLQYAFLDAENNILKINKNKIKGNISGVTFNTFYQIEVVNGKYALKETEEKFVITKDIHKEEMLLTNKKSIEKEMNIYFKYYHFLHTFGTLVGMCILLAIVATITCVKYFQDYTVLPVIILAILGLIRLTMGRIYLRKLLNSK